LLSLEVFDLAVEFAHKLGGIRVLFHRSSGVFIPSDRRVLHDQLAEFRRFVHDLLRVDRHAGFLVKIKSAGDRNPDRGGIIRANLRFDIPSPYKCSFLANPTERKAEHFDVIAWSVP